jgi:hypothetical protein
MLTKRRILAGKIEASEGVAETLTNSETGITIIDPKWTPDIKMLPRLAVLPTLSKVQQIPGMQLAHISFKTELVGRVAAFAANNLPLIDPYLRACGFAATLVVTPGSETVTYAPASSSVPSITLGLYTDGVIKKIHGARGTVKFSGNNGEVMMAEFDFIGAYNAPIDGAMLTGTFLAVTPPIMNNALMTIGGYTPVFKSFSIDMGNKLAPREDANAVTGYKSFMIADRDPSGSFDPEMTLVASKDWYGLWKGGTSGALNIGAVGATQYNKIQIAAPKAVFTKVGEGEREGLELANCDFQLAMSSGDDEISIKFL